MSRLTPFVIGQIKAHAYHQLGPSAIAAIVKKEDGTHPSVQAVADALAKLELAQVGVDIVSSRLDINIRK